MTSPPVAAARAKAVGAAEDEYRRLLYVAMTRAADRLVVAGSRGVNRAPRRLLVRADRTRAESGGDRGAGRRRRRHVCMRWRKSADIVPGAASAAPEPLRDTTVPDWLTRNAPAETAPRVISPSLTGPAGARRAGIGDRRALARGRIVHRLLQALPALPPRTPRRGRAQASRARQGSRRHGARRASARGLRGPRRCTLRIAVRRELARRGADRRLRFTE